MKLTLKNYQERSLEKVAQWFDCLREANYDGEAAWNAYWARQGKLALADWHDPLDGVPMACLKVPTGGGKTLLGCASLRHFFVTHGPLQPRLCLWLVPSEAILTQTLKALTKPGHPYHDQLKSDFGGHVVVLDKAQALAGQDFTPQSLADNLTVIVMTFASLRRKGKEGLKAYQDNGSLLGFGDENEASLVGAIQSAHPLVVVDESHNATSELSLDMLSDLNPRAVLELTATPKAHANIIADVRALELKRANMIKLPITVLQAASADSALTVTINLQRKLEYMAQNMTKEDQLGEPMPYIRPIALIQAQSDTGDSALTHGVLKRKLISLGVDESWIGVKTSNVDTLKGLDLTDQACPIRFIITVNALKEGWDCPFAYLLCSTANRSSETDVTQIVGRVLRQPGARPLKEPLLEQAYVVTSSDRFSATVKSVIAGLQNAGFDKAAQWVQNSLPFEVPKSNSAPDEGPVSQAPSVTQPQPSVTNPAPAPVQGPVSQAPSVIQPQPSVATPASTPSWAPVATGEQCTFESNNPGWASVPPVTGDNLDEVLKRLSRCSEPQASSNPFGAQGSLGLAQFNRLRDEFAVFKELKMPRFYRNSALMLIGGRDLVSQEGLLAGFSLEACPVTNFELKAARVQAQKVDVDDEGVTVRAVSDEDRRFWERDFTHKSPEEARKHCAELAIRQWDDDNTLSRAQVRDYMTRTLAKVTDEQLRELKGDMTPLLVWTKETIKSLKRQHRKTCFNKELKDGDITVQLDEGYTWREREMKDLSTQSDPATKSTKKGLYQVENIDDLTAPEKELVKLLEDCSAVLWWHRIDDTPRKTGRDFYINGPINHAPDFAVYTDTGHLVLVECKGPQMVGSPDTTAKLNLGETWENGAPTTSTNQKKYHYFMVSQTYVSEADSRITTFDSLINRLSALPELSPKDKALPEA